MPKLKTRKQLSREKIVNSAAKLFTRKGFDNVSIDDLMDDAGLTRGAFYSHFKDKSSLYAEAIIVGAIEGRLSRRNIIKKTRKEGLGVVLEEYLCNDHLYREEPPCPLAFLTTDISHREPLVRDTYTRVYAGMVERMQTLSLPHKEESRETVLAVTAMMIGGVAIANALNDEVLVKDLLDACQTVGKSVLGSSH